MADPNLLEEVKKAFDSGNKEKAEQYLLACNDESNYLLGMMNHKNAVDYTRKAEVHFHNAAEKGHAKALRWLAEQTSEEYPSMVLYYHSVKAGFTVSYHRWSVLAFFVEQWLPIRTADQKWSSWIRNHADAAQQHDTNQEQLRLYRAVVQHEKAVVEQDSAKAKAHEEHLKMAAVENAKKAAADDKKEVEDIAKKIEERTKLVREKFSVREKQGSAVENSLINWSARIRDRLLSKEPSANYTLAPVEKDYKIATNVQGLVQQLVCNGVFSYYGEGMYVEARTDQWIAYLDSKKDYLNGILRNARMEAVRMADKWVIRIPITAEDRETLTEKAAKMVKANDEHLKRRGQTDTEYTPVDADGNHTGGPFAEWVIRLRKRIVDTDAKKFESPGLIAVSMSRQYGLVESLRSLIQHHVLCGKTEKVGYGVVFEVKFPEWSKYLDEHSSLLNPVLSPYKIGAAKRNDKWHFDIEFERPTAEETLQIWSTRIRKALTDKTTEVRHLPLLSDSVEKSFRDLVEHQVYTGKANRVERGFSMRVDGLWHSYLMDNFPAIDRMFAPVKMKYLGEARIFIEDEDQGTRFGNIAEDVKKMVLKQDSDIVSKTMVPQTLGEWASKLRSTVVAEGRHIYPGCGDPKKDATAMDNFMRLVDYIAKNRNMHSHPDRFEWRMSDTWDSAWFGYIRQHMHTLNSELAGHSISMKMERTCTGYDAIILVIRKEEIPEKKGVKEWAEQMRSLHKENTVDPSTTDAYPLILQPSRFAVNFRSLVEFLILTGRMPHGANPHFQVNDPEWVPQLRSYEAEINHVFGEHGFILVAGRLQMKTEPSVEDMTRETFCQVLRVSLSATDSDQRRFLPAIQKERSVDVNFRHLALFLVDKRRCITTGPTSYALHTDSTDWQAYLKDNRGVLDSLYAPHGIRLCEGGEVGMYFVVDRVAPVPGMVCEEALPLAVSNEKLPEWCDRIRNWLKAKQTPIPKVYPTGSEPEISHGTADRACNLQILVLYYASKLSFINQSDRFITAVGSPAWTSFLKTNIGTLNSTFLPYGITVIEDARQVLHIAIDKEVLSIVRKAEKEKQKIAQWAAGVRNANKDCMTIPPRKVPEIDHADPVGAFMALVDFLLGSGRVKDSAFCCATDFYNWEYFLRCHADDFNFIFNRHGIFIKSTPDGNREINLKFSAPAAAEVDVPNGPLVIIGTKVETPVEIIGPALPSQMMVSPKYWCKDIRDQLKDIHCMTRWDYLTGKEPLIAQDSVDFNFRTLINFFIAGRHVMQLESYFYLWVEDYDWISYFTKHSEEISTLYSAFGVHLRDDGVRGMYCVFDKQLAVPIAAEVPKTAGAMKTADLPKASDYGPRLLSEEECKRLRLLSEKIPAQQVAPKTAEVPKIAEQPDAPKTADAKKTTEAPKTADVPNTYTPSEEKWWVEWIKQGIRGVKEPSGTADPLIMYDKYALSFRKFVEYIVATVGFTPSGTDFVYTVKQREWNMFIVVHCDEINFTYKEHGAYVQVKEKQATIVIEKARDPAVVAAEALVQVKSDAHTPPETREVDVKAQNEKKAEQLAMDKHDVVTWSECVKSFAKDCLAKCTLVCANEIFNYTKRGFHNIPKRMLSTYQKSDDLATTLTRMGLRYDLKSDGVWNVSETVNEAKVELAKTLLKQGDRPVLTTRVEDTFKAVVEDVLQRGEFDYNETHGFSAVLSHKPFESYVDKHLTEIHAMFIPHIYVVTENKQLKLVMWPRAPPLGLSPDGWEMVCAACDSDDRPTADGKCAKCKNEWVGMKDEPPGLERNWGPPGPAMNYGTPIDLKHLETTTDGKKEDLKKTPAKWEADITPAVAAFPSPKIQRVESKGLGALVAATMPMKVQREGEAWVRELAKAPWKSDGLISKEQNDGFAALQSQLDIVTRQLARESRADEKQKLQKTLNRLNEDITNFRVAFSIRS